jgi:hypothetical protein
VVVPESYPSFQFRAYLLGVVPESYPSFQFRAYLLGVVPESYPSFQFRAYLLGVVPESYPSFQFRAYLLGVTHLAFVSANELASLSTFTLTLEILIGRANTLAYRGKQNNRHWNRKINKKTY